MLVAYDESQLLASSNPLPQPPKHLLLQAIFLSVPKISRNLYFCAVTFIGLKDDRSGGTCLLKSQHLGYTHMQNGFGGVLENNYLMKVINEN